MSASTTPTDRPRAASAAARFTVTDDLPTPPLPDATQYTPVSEPGWANGITASAAPPRRPLRISARCSSLMTSSSTRTAVTPGTRETASVTRLVIVSRIGQPATVRNTPISATPSTTTTLLTIPSSVIGRWISGSSTVASAACTACSTVPVGVFALGDKPLRLAQGKSVENRPPCYVRLRSPLRPQHADQLVQVPGPREVRHARGLDVPALPGQELGQHELGGVALGELLLAGA